MRPVLPSQTRAAQTDTSTLSQSCQCMASLHISSCFSIYTLSPSFSISPIPSFHQPLPLGFPSQALKNPYLPLHLPFQHPSAFPIPFCGYPFLGIQDTWYSLRLPISFHFLTSSQPCTSGKSFPPLLKNIYLAALGLSCGLRDRRLLSSYSQKAQ